MSEKNRKPKNYWLVKENTINESKKYSSRIEFHKYSYEAYNSARKNGWLDEMTWLTKKNICKDPVDCVYKYHFINENAVYIGRTIYPELRDQQHRTREKDTVNRFAKEHNTEIPKMEIIETNLTVLEGSSREIYWGKYYRDNGFCIIMFSLVVVLALCVENGTKKNVLKKVKNIKQEVNFKKMHHKHIICQLQTTGLII
jgi:hypothetical protein